MIMNDEVESKYRLELELTRFKMLQQNFRKLAEERNGKPHVARHPAHIASAGPLFVTCGP